MPLTVTTAPTAQAVSLQSIKDQVQILNGEDDEYLRALIAAATDAVESDTGRALVTQTLRLTLDRFPACIRLPRPPVQSVTSVAYLDSDGVSRTLTETTDYRVSLRDTTSVIEPAWGTTWPTTRPVVDAVTVTYVAGYGSDEDTSVPKGLQQAIALLVGHYHAHREAVVTGTTVTDLKQGYEAMTTRYKVGDRLVVA